MKELAPEMMEFLIDCHQRELQKTEPCTGLVKNRVAKSLLLRNLIKAMPFVNSTGKVCMGYFITSTGKSCLARHMEQTNADFSQA